MSAGTLALSKPINYLGTPVSELNYDFSKLTGAHFKDNLDPMNIKQAAARLLIVSAGHRGDLLKYLKLRDYQRVLALGGQLFEERYMQALTASDSRVKDSIYTLAEPIECDGRAISTLRIDLDEASGEQVFGALDDGDVNVAGVAAVFAYNGVPKRAVSNLSTNDFLALWFIGSNFFAEASEESD